MAKPFILGFIETNEKSIECNFYKTVGVNAYVAAAASVFTGQFYAAGGAALVGGAAELAYNLSDCSDSGPPPGSDLTKECWKTIGPGLFQHTRNKDDWFLNASNIVEILTQTVQMGSNGVLQSTGQVVTERGGIQNYYVSHYDSSDTRVRLVGTCADGGEQPSPPVTHQPGEPISDPVEVPDPDTGCNWTIQATDAYVDDYGEWHTYYTVTADNDACGGPFAYWSSKDGPQFVPVPPDPTPDPTPPGPKPPSDEDGCCDELKALLEEIKECACGSNEQPLEGDYRTITFISDENSPEGKRRLSKRFRYRSSSGIGLSGVVDHWRSFTWQAGAVCVSHKGSTLGAPQVWAATAEEGKRVIRHAAGEAGIDADQVGRWLVSGSVDPRYGMPGTMRVNTKGGYYWITSRLGPDQRPLVEES